RVHHYSGGDTADVAVRATGRQWAPCPTAGTGHGDGARTLRTLCAGQATGPAVGYPAPGWTGLRRLRRRRRLDPCRPDATRGARLGVLHLLGRRHGRPNRRPPAGRCAGRAGRAAADVRSVRGWLSGYSCGPGRRPVAVVEEAVVILGITTAVQQ